MVSVRYQQWFLRGQRRRFVSASLWRHRPVSRVFVTVLCSSENGSCVLDKAQRGFTGRRLDIVFLIQLRKTWWWKPSPVTGLVAWLSQSHQSFSKDPDLAGQKTLWFKRFASDVMSFYNPLPAFHLCSLNVNKWQITACVHAAYLLVCHRSAGAEQASHLLSFDKILTAAVRFQLWACSPMTAWSRFTTFQCKGAALATVQISLINQFCYFAIVAIPKRTIKS